MIRRHCREHLCRRLVRRTAPLAPEDIQQPTVVLAPHPDDETLGCGGLVALLRDASVPVTIVFLTDGASSHASMTRDELAARRRSEATAAASTLGVPSEHLHFLELRDGRLGSSVAEAVHLLVPILRDTGAAQLVLPHPLEPPSDHRATHEIAELAARELGATYRGLRYPVWLWDQWPFTNPLAPPAIRHSRRRIVSVAFRERFGLRMERRLTHRIDIGSALERKKRALDAHVSQMSKPDGDESWLTLSDICDGEWLDLLLQPYEFYEATAIGEVRQ